MEESIYANVRLRLVANQTCEFTYRHLPGFLQDWWQWQVMMTPLVCQRSGDASLAPVIAAGGRQLSKVVGINRIYGF
ncbi:hypothetical protein [Aeromonas veronii]|uniref:hypothetical protein n=1 Tax=Aeromonas veronii TaxID=654 RepID=UPI003F7A61E3